MTIKPIRTFTKNKYGNVKTGCDYEVIEIKDDTGKKIELHERFVMR